MMFSMPSPTMVALIGALHVLVAGSVTVDVLLKKSDVRGALGWIGAAWFSPFLGGLLYYLFGINRVTRRALKMGRLGDAQAPAPERSSLPDAQGQIRQLLEV